MTSIKPGGLHGSDKKLRSVRVGSSIGHGKVVRSHVLQVEVLVSKFFSIDTVVKIMCVGKRLVLP